MFAAGLINQCPSLKDVELLGSDRQHKIFDRFKFLMPNPKKQSVKNMLKKTLNNTCPVKEFLWGIKSKTLEIYFQNFVSRR